ncbi:hypothetical protein RJ639_039323 [Escallonia herrerae]|uniref:GATA transcription factor n=1 Tax=Escallonia herrerae TaxID=1293975 RepID=A0AA88X0X1_9ASTE|nr:hypothetical protein RJ639_039323 [Escallonia herrerae]
MDMYGLSAPDLFRVDDLLDFSNDDIFSHSTTPDSSSSYQFHHHHHHNHLPLSTENTSSAPYPDHSTNFTDDLCVPNDDVAELEWLSNFVDDSFGDIPANGLTQTVKFRPDAQFHGRSRSKRTRAPSTNSGWTSSLESHTPLIGRSKRESSSSTASSEEQVARRCTHCASEKTPQWRTGPLGPKTLCNACGVRYKSGRLVPEYRPAASPTFVLTQHSNSHRKVMELRRQKEQSHQQQPPEHHQLYGHHQNYQVC